MTSQEDVALLKTALDKLSDGVVVADREGKFLIFNPAAERMLGVGARDLSPDEWITTYGCYLPDKVTPYPPDQLPLHRAMQGNEVDEELIYIRNSQKASGVWISVKAQPMRDEEGIIWGGMAVFHDISRHKMADESLHSTTLKLASLVESQQAGILVESEDRKVLLVNQAFCEMFGVPAVPEELIGDDSSKYAQRAKALFCDPEEFSSRIEELLRDRSVVVNEELSLVDGRVLQRDYIPIFVHQEYRGHFWQYRDISEHRRVQEKIEVYQRLCSALEQTADTVLITDKRGIIEYVNPAFETTTGYSRDEALGKTPRILKSGEHDEHFYRHLWGEICAGRALRHTVVNRKKTGELYWAHQTITPLKEDNGNVTHFVSVLKDITDLIEKKDQEAKMRLAREVQQRFYQITASVPGFDIAGAAYPADETGGDYFDFIDMSNGCLGIAVGDVSGHGISAALVMAATRAYVRSFAATGSDVANILTQVNRALIPDLDNGQFVTLLLCLLDPNKRTLTYASAGHVPGFLLNNAGEVDRTLGGTGPPLGLFADSAFAREELALSDSGQIVLLPTDGILESVAPDDTQFGIERVIQYIGYRKDRHARQIVEGLYRATRTHAGDQVQLDDATAVILKVL